MNQTVTEILSPEERHILYPLLKQMQPTQSFNWEVHWKKEQGAKQPTQLCKQIILRKHPQNISKSITQFYL